MTAIYIDALVIALFGFGGDLATTAGMGCTVAQRAIKHDPDSGIIPTMVGVNDNYA